jgi:hypothetical protein
MSRHPFGWDYPPGVTGREPQITGELGDCERCGERLDEDDELAEVNNNELIHASCMTEEDTIA